MKQLDEPPLVKKSITIKPKINTNIDVYPMDPIKFHIEQDFLKSIELDLCFVPSLKPRKPMKFKTFEDWERKMVFSVVNSKTGMRSNLNLANSIKTKSWLNDEMILGFAESRIISLGLTSYYHVIKSFYFGDIANSSKMETLLSRLEQTYAMSKKTYFVIINTFFGQ